MRANSVVLIAILAVTGTARSESYTVNTNEPEAFPLHVSAALGLHLPINSVGAVVLPIQGAYDLGNRLHAGGRIQIPLRYLRDPKRGFFDAEAGGALFLISGRTPGRLTLIGNLSAEGENLRRRSIGVRGGIKLFKTAVHTSDATATYGDYDFTMLIGYAGLDMLWRENFDINTESHGRKATTRMVDWYFDVMYGLSGTDGKAPAGLGAPEDGTTKLGWRFGINWISGHPLGVSIQTELGTLPGIKGDFFGLLSLGLGSNLL